MPPPLLLTNVTLFKIAVVVPAVAEIETAGSIADLGAVFVNRTVLLTKYKTLETCMGTFCCGGEGHDEISESDTDNAKATCLGHTKSTTTDGGVYRVRLNGVVVELYVAHRR